jgi:hypothetical protein
LIHPAEHLMLLLELQELLLLLLHLGWAGPT